MKKIYLLSIIIAVLSFMACDDFLTEEPKMQQSTELTLETFKGLNDAMFGAYAPLVSTSWYGAAFVLDAEMRSGNGFRDLGANSGRYTGSYNLNYTSTSTPGLWGTAYYVISAVNNVIENLNEDKLGGGVTQQDLDNIHAEGLFLRALAHFDLVRTHGIQYTKDKNGLGVPYIFVTDPAGEPARDTVEDVYNYIVADLTTAEGMLAPNYKRPEAEDPRSVVTTEAIQALLSRVYLYMGEWQKSADYSSKIINSSKFKLWAKDEYVAAFKADVPAGGEVIFEVFGVKSNSYDGYWDAITHMTRPDGYADCATSNDLLELYGEDDVRGELYRLHPNQDDYPDTKWTAKYAGKDKGTPDVSNTIVLRLSEMYINRAEAIVRGATVPGVTAVADLNAVRSNRGVEPLSSAAMGDIMNERRLEFAWEGHHWYDLARTGGSITRVHYSGAETNRNVPSDSKYWALPIHDREFDVNPNLVQNPGY